MAKKKASAPADNKPEGKRFILAVRNNRSSIHIDWKQGEDKHGADFHDNPLPGFYKALEALAPHAAALCELPAKDADKFVVKGITCREDGDNVKALIVVTKKVKRGKRVYSHPTPLLPMYADSENSSLDHMEQEQAAAIEAVIEAAIDYLDGNRAQGQIQFEGEGDSDKAEKEEEANVENLPGLPKA